MSLVMISCEYYWCHTGSNAVHVGAFNVTCYRSTIVEGLEPGSAVVFQV